MEATPTQHLDRLDRDLEDVDVALRRLDDGTYFTCEVCGAKLAAEVLDARPAARDCGAHPASEGPVAVLAGGEPLDLGGEQAERP